MSAYRDNALPQPVRCTCGWAQPVQIRTRLETTDADAKIAELTLVCPDCRGDCAVPLTDSYNIPPAAVAADAKGSAK